MSARDSKGLRDAVVDGKTMAIVAKELGRPSGTTLYVVPTARADWRLVDVH